MTLEDCVPNEIRRDNLKKSIEITKEGITICWDDRGIEHYRDRKTGKFISKTEAINNYY